MRQCINTYCLHHQKDNALFCNQCGCKFFIDERLIATRLLSENSLISSPRTQTFEAFDIEDQQVVILRVVDSDNPVYLEPLKLAVYALNMVHAEGKFPGIMQLVDERHHFTEQIRTDEPPAQFMVARKVEGVSLTEWLKQHGPISESLAKDWLKQLLKIAKKLHDSNFLHRDIKPDNIIVANDLQLVLIDFDTIYQLTDRYVRVPRIGTGAYMAPEQSNGSPLPTSDLYSIGRTLTECLTGKFPFDIARTANERVDWEKEASSLSKPFTNLIDRIANRNTLFRPPDASEALTYLAEVEAIPPRRRSWRWLGTPLVKAAITVLAVSIPIAAIGGYALSQIQTDGLTLTEANELVEEGNQLIIQGEERRGLSLLERAVQLAPESADIRAKLAIAQAFSRDFNSAIKNYNIALELAPDNPNILHGIADVYEEVDLQKSKLYYQQAAAAAREAEAPILPLTLNNLARVYLLTDQLREAGEVLAEINTDIEEPILRMTVFKNLGWLNYEQGNYEGAREYLNQALEADATFADPYCLLALIQQQNGEDNYNDRATCIYLNSPAKPEVVAWREELIGTSEQN